MDVTEAVLKWFDDHPQRHYTPSGKPIVVPVNMGMSRLAVIVSKELDVVLDHETRSLFQEIMAQRAMSQAPTKIDPVTLSRLALDFTQAYVGDNLPTQLENYIDKCWSRYVTQPMEPVHPFFAIVQSSGFGKSRLVRELALRTKDKMNADAVMRVLYVCLRRPEDTTGYPKRTTDWPEHLFPYFVGSDDTNEMTLTSRLVTVFKNAMREWNTVGQECFLHFENGRSGQFTLKKLSRRATSSRNSNSDSISHHTTISTHERRRVLVLALDEARCLLPTAYDTTGWFRRIQRALKLANIRIREKYGYFAGIFAILIDANLNISSLTMKSAFSTPKKPSLLDSSGRLISSDEACLQPFVLTHTMDLMLEEKMMERHRQGVSTGAQFYQELVQKDTEEAVDVGDIQDVVARIVLLLAMDATGVLTTGSLSGRAYDGEFFSVSMFLRALSGDSSVVKTLLCGGAALDVDTLLSPWSSWKVGFSHFVQLDREPAEEVLWSLLSRRAACVVRRRVKGAVATDLMIPIFKSSDDSSSGGSEVSVILVRVSGEGELSSHSDPVLSDTCPSVVFRGEPQPQLQERREPVANVVRVHMVIGTGVGNGGVNVGVDAERAERYFVVGSESVMAEKWLDVTRRSDVVVGKDVEVCPAGSSSSSVKTTSKSTSKAKAKAKSSAKRRRESQSAVVKKPRRKQG
ncbi:hypothetical protein Poli38472_004395 [Pythium oligandrum]|uniref:Uncharacterized protein n=1 Tax=Pythium oligandrum TaxID=41045 RepID=A0A8K1FEE1_PYTOL|nr:hypothetical protein Poli38472_004395 [Pythium oligandrum]|eukprot:TMW59326.1 hypothetical protein Poli38472_004395 [Pythium oligandrum]